MEKRIMVGLLIFPLFAWQSLFGQEDYCLCPVTLITETNLAGELFRADHPIDPVTYFTRDWTLGEITLITGEIVGNEMIRYNGLLDELFWLEPGSKRTILLDKEAIEQFEIQPYQNSGKIRFKKIVVKPDLLTDSTAVFGQVIYEAAFSLFVLHTFIIERLEYFKLAGATYKKPVYQSLPVYYLRFPDKKMLKLGALTRKNLYTAFPAKKEQLKKFLRENLSGRTWEDEELVRFAQFLNEMIKKD